MSKCDLSFRLDEADARFLIGDVVKGTLEVRVDAKCRCDALTVTRLWRTHGRGNTARGGEEVQTLFTGEWRAGESLEYPFEFTIPPGPITYHGHYLNIDHYLEARADIPWAFDPKAETELLVELGDDPKAYRSSGDVGGGSMSPEEQAALLAKGKRLMGICLPIFGAVFAIPGLIAIAVSAWQVSNGNMESVIGLVVGTIFAMAGLGIAFMGVRSALAERKLGPVIAGCTPTQGVPGENLSFNLEFTPQGRGRVSRITVTVSGKESVVSGSGTNRTTHTHKLHEEVVELDGGCDLFPGSPVELSGVATLPKDAAYSFQAPNNTIAWTVSFHIDVASWPDWTSSVPLLVLP